MNAALAKLENNNHAMLPQKKETSALVETLEYSRVYPLMETVNLNKHLTVKVRRLPAAPLQTLVDLELPQVVDNSVSPSQQLALAHAQSEWYE